MELLSPELCCAEAFPYSPDQGDGTFRNPILCADYSDPDVVRHGDDFYLVASSFNCTPALPILHSRDLVNWTLINHAVKNLPRPRYAQVQTGCGVWAPAIRFHDGKFWIFFPLPDEGIFVTTASDPAGKWSEPHCVVEGKGLIDPCPLWEEDGQAYLVHAYARSRAGIKHRLRVCPMAPDASRLLGEGYVVFDDESRHPTLEGPKFLRRDGWYYILAPAGGVETGWQVALRSRQIYGPYEDKIVLAQGETAINGPHQGALIDTPRGQWWFVHFQDAGFLGRITHLQPAQWQDGWPLMGVGRDENGCGEPQLHGPKPDLPIQSPATPQNSDEFENPKLGLQWQWHANHRDDWHSLTARPKWLRLFSQCVESGDLSRVPNLLAQKFPARFFAVETQLELAAQEVGEQAGIVVMGLSHAALLLRKTESGHQIVYVVDGQETVVLPLSGASVQLRVEVRNGECRFSYAAPESDFVAVETPFQAREGHWIGAKIGICSINFTLETAGHADFAYFRFSEVEGEKESQ